MSQDYFLKIEGIEGESQDKTHKNEIEIESISFGVAQGGGMGYGGGGGVGKASFQDISFTKKVDKATTKISESWTSPSANSYSLRAAVSASFCTCIGTGGTPARLSAWVMSGKKATLRQPRLGAKRSTPLASSNAPGRPTPTPSSCTS